MSTYDDAASKGVMIAFLPVVSDWCRIELPHMTLVYAGPKDKMKASDFNAMAKDAASIAMLAKRFYLRVTGLDVFGDPGEQVDVIRLQPTSELWAMRRFVEHWNASEHPFNPHATIGPVGEPVMNVPSAIAFDRLIFSFGGEDLTFWLNR